MNIEDLNNDLLPIDLRKVCGGIMETQNSSPVVSHLPVNASSQLFNFEIQRPGSAQDRMGNFEIQKPTRSF